MHVKVDGGRNWCAPAKHLKLRYLCRRAMHATEVRKHWVCGQNGEKQVPNKHHIAGGVVYGLKPSVALRMKGPETCSSYLLHFLIVSKSKLYLLYLEWDTHHPQFHISAWLS